MEPWIVLLLVVDGVIAHYGFEFQRTTLGIARTLRQHTPAEISRFQAGLTPTWVGGMCAVGFATMIASAVVCFLWFGWIGLTVYLLVRHVGLALAGPGLPPTRLHYLALIESHVKREHGPEAWSEMMSALGQQGVTRSALESLR